MTRDALTHLRDRLGEIADVRGAIALLQWDEQTKMPPGGTEARANQLGTLERMAHERLVADELGELLDELAGVVDPDGDDDDASLVRVAARRHRKARRVPGQLVAQIAHQASIGQREWFEARRRDDIRGALGSLERSVELAREYGSCFDGDPYDALLDDYEEGISGDEVARVFDSLKVELSRLRTEIAQSDSGAPVVLRGPFGIDEQRLLVRDLLGRLGFDEREWRVDEAAHPFLAAIAPTDIRLTTRYREDGFDSILAALHEFGHGMYSHGVDPALARTPLGTSASTGLDESQSRFWENVIGRSRAFAQFLHPLLAERFPAALAGTDAESLYRALNVVEPSPIRVTADEVHYSLHVIVRFEVERELIAGTLAATDIAARFDALMEEYVGLEPTTDALGALQDVHWWAGAFGYFPTYALGNVMSLQVVERLKKEVPALEENVAAGRFGPIQDWLRESIYRHGAKHTGAEVLERVTGHRLEAGPYVRYLRGKFGPLYGLAG